MGPGNAWASPQGYQSQTIKIKHLKKAVQQPAAGAGPMLAARPCFLRFFRIFSLDISRQSTGLACSTGPAWPCPVLDTPARNGPGGWAQPNGGRPGILLDGPAWRQQYPCDPGNVENNFPRSTLRGDNNTRWPLGRRLCLATNDSIPKAPRVLLSPRRVHLGKLGSTQGRRLQQVHPVKCRVGLRSARPAGPAPLRRPNPAAGYQAGRLPRKTFSDNLTTPGLAASPSLVLAASCQSFFRRISVIQTSSEQLPNKAYRYRLARGVGWRG